MIVEESKKDGKVFYSVFDLEDSSKKLKKTSSPGRSSGSGGLGVGKEPSDRTIASESNIKQDLKKGKGAKTLADFVRSQGGISGQNGLGGEVALYDVRLAHLLPLFKKDEIASLSLAMTNKR